MPTIHINVKNRVATANGDSRIINGNSDYIVEFDFDAEWADLNNKIGIFAYNDATAHKWAYQTVMFSGNTCTVPILRDIHCVYVGVTAGNVRVTTPAKVQCRLSISDYADTEEPPSADIWGQILAKLDELQTEIDEIKAGGVGGTPDWAQNDPDGEGYIKNRCGGYDDVQTRESELLSLDCPADKSSAETFAPPSFFPPSAGDIISVTVDGSTKEYIIGEITTGGESRLWFGTQNPSSITNFDAFFASDKWFGDLGIDESSTTLSIGILYGSLSEIAGKTVGLKQRRLSVTPVKINRRYLDVPDWAKADSKPTYTANDVGAVPTDSVTTAVTAESTNENVPTAKAVYDALQDIGTPSGTDISLGVTGATVGQTVNVKTVDADGKPTAWEAVDMAAGGGAEVYYAELDGEYPSYTLSADTPLADIAKAYAANKSIVCRCKVGGMTATLPLFIPMPERNAWFFSGAGALDEQYPAQTFTVAITPLGVEAEQKRIAAQTALDAVTATANEAVLYTLQTLGYEQKQQAQKNIGINPEDRTTSMTNPVGVDGYGKLWSKADTSLGVTGATVGQTIKVKAVDADGKPTAWEAVDMAAGDTWETLAETTLEEESVPILDIGAMASSFSRLRFYFTFPIVESVEKVKVSLSIPNATTGSAYDMASINRGNDKSESWAFIDFYPLIYNGICYMSMIESAKVGITNNTTQQFQYNSYDYYRISEARYVRTSKPLPTGATITIMGVRK